MKLTITLNGAVLCVVVVFWIGMVTAPTAFASPQISSPATAPSGTLHELEQVFEAIQLGERREYKLAAASWKRLIDARPRHSVYRMNFVATTLAYLRALTQRMENAKGREKESWLIQISDNLLIVDDQLKLLREMSANDPRITLLSASYAKRRAAVSSEKDKQSAIMEAAFAELLNESERLPPSAVLAVALPELLWTREPEVSVRKRYLDVLYRAWVSQPDNSFLMVLCGEELLRERDSRTVTVAKSAARELASQMKSLERWISSQQILELVENATDAIDSDDWISGQTLHRFYNVLKGTNSYSIDARRLRRWEMDLVDESELSVLNKVIRQEQHMNGNRLAFAIATLPLRKAKGASNAIAWIDFDLDLDFDLAVAVGRVLEIYEQRNASEFVLAGTIELPFAPQGLLAADLFMVDHAQRPRLTTNPREWQQLERHNTFQDLIAYSKGEISVVTHSSPGDLGLKIVDGTGLDLHSSTDINDIKATDIDLDGDLDIVLATDEGLRTFVNAGDRTFSDASQSSQFLQPNSPLIAFCVCDLDRDSDGDLIGVAKESGQLLKYENIGGGRFVETVIQGASHFGKAFALDDIDGDLRQDLSIVSGSRITTLATDSFKAIKDFDFSGAMKGEPIKRLSIADFDNNGWTDFLVVNDQGISLLPRIALDKLGELQLIMKGSIYGESIIDANLDGVLDIAALVDGQPRLYFGETAGKAIEVELRGFDDANGSGRNNHYMGGSTVQVLTRNGIQLRTMEATVVHFGISDCASAKVRSLFLGNTGSRNFTTSANSRVLLSQSLAGWRSWLEPSSVRSLSN